MRGYRHRVVSNRSGSRLDGILTEKGREVFIQREIFIVITMTYLGVVVVVVIGLIGEVDCTAVC